MTRAGHRGGTASPPVVSPASTPGSPLTVAGAPAWARRRGPAWCRSRTPTAVAVLVAARSVGGPAFRRPHEPAETGPSRTGPRRLADRWRNRDLLIGCSCSPSPSSEGAWTTGSRRRDRRYHVLTGLAARLRGIPCRQTTRPAGSGRRSLDRYGVPSSCASWPLIGHAPSRAVRVRHTFRLRARRSLCGGRAASAPRSHERGPTIRPAPPRVSVSPDRVLRASEPGPPTIGFLATTARLRALIIVAARLVVPYASPHGPRPARRPGIRNPRSTTGRVS